MKVVQINVVKTGSTGRIMTYIDKELKNKNIEAHVFYGRGKKSIDGIKTTSNLSFFIHASMATIFDLQGHLSYFSTRKLVKQIQNINPDVIHLHNIHGYYLNYKLLFKYLNNEYKGKIVWTLHDCLAFTGTCSHFTYVECNKWQTKCHTCPQKSQYPKSIFLDRSKKEHKLKKEIYGINKDILFTVPSNWLKQLVNLSFLKNNKTAVINNFIDFNVFKYQTDDNLYQKYNIDKTKKIYLGVANVWEDRKGLKIFYEMSEQLKKDEQIVLVGLTDKQIKKLPKGIIGIRRTSDAKELACLYSMSTVFVNPSVEETFSLVTLESLGCKTPVVVLDTSAVKELVLNEECGYISKNNAKDILKLTRTIKHRVSDETVNKLIDKYNYKKIITEYINLYK